MSQHPVGGLGEVQHTVGAKRLVGVQHTVRG